MRTYLYFFKKALITNIKVSLSRKLSLVFSLIFAFITRACFIASWKSLFNHYDSVANWHFKEMLLLQGLISLSLGITESLFFGLKNINIIIESGQLDIYLFQPKNIIFKIAYSKISFTSLGEILTGIVLLFLSKYILENPLNLFIVLAINVIFVLSLLIYTGSVSLYIKGDIRLSDNLKSVSMIAASQPNSSYTGILKHITLTILPIAYYSFFPIEYLRTGHYKFLLISIIGTISFFIFSLVTFYNGLKKYNSGSSMVTMF